MDKIEVLVHMLYNNLLESSRHLRRSVAGIQHKDPLSGTDEGLSVDLVEGGLFHADLLLWMAPSQMSATIWLLPYVSFA